MSISTFEQVIRDMKSGAFDFTKDGECSGCGQCCSNILPISATDAKRILKYVRRKHIKECVHQPPTAQPYEDYTCPFRDDEKKICTIYEVRPAICKDFRCDKPKKGILADRDLLHERFAVVDMRETFFPKG